MCIGRFVKILLFMSKSIAYTGSMVTDTIRKKTPGGMKHTTSLADAPAWALDSAKAALKIYELMRLSRSKEPNNYTIKSWIRTVQKTIDLLLRDGRFLNREASVLKPFNHMTPAGTGLAVKVLQEQIAFYEGMLATNKSPNFFINYTLYTLACMFKAQTGSPCYQEVGIIIGEVFKGSGAVPKQMGDPAGWASQRVMRFLRLVRNESAWKKALATFERALLCNGKINPPLRFNFTTPTQPLTVEDLGNGKYMIQLEQKSAQVDPPRNTVALKPRSLPRRWA
jgi:hypothetical protein